MTQTKITTPGITDTNITNAKLGTDISATKITADTLADARIPDLNASKITSGTLADARISASAVTQHVTATDLSGVNADITALALREATNESSAAFNLPNKFIETFTDDTNLGTQTSVDRTSGYMSSVIAGTGIDANTVVMLHFETAPASAIVDSSDNSSDISFTKMGSASTDATQAKFGTYSYHNEQSSSDYLKSNALNTGLTRAFPTTGDFTVDFWAYQTTFETSNRPFSIGNGTNTTSGAQPMMTWSNNSGSPSTINNHSGLGSFNPPVAGSVNILENVWQHYVVQRTGTKLHNYVNGKIYWNTTNQTFFSGANLMSNGYDLWLGSRSNYGSTEHWRGYIDEFRISNIARYASSASNDTTVFTPETTAYTSTTASATGTLIQSANTVGSAKTSVGGTMLYKDNAGTATLGTDLKIYFSCNNGGAWTEASSYNAITPVYSTGIKQVRLGQTTCTSGTGVIYKAVWANQALGSKETQLHGIGINY